MTTPRLAEKEAEFLQQSASYFEEISEQDIDDVREAIAKSAYFKAEKRGFQPGYEVPDWLEAEAEIKAART